MMPSRGAVRPFGLLLACLATALAVMAVAASFRLDAPTRAAILESQGKGWKKSPEARFHGTVRKAGDWPWLMAGGAAGFALAWRLGSKRWMRALAAAMIASTLAGAIANASRLTTGRTRPRASPEVQQGFYGPWHDGRLTIGDSKFNSFPSGHAATAFGFAIPLLLSVPWFGLMALTGAGLVAWSSLAIGAHHPSDIVVSLLISIGVAWAVTRLIATRGDAWAERLRGAIRRA